MSYESVDICCNLAPKISKEDVLCMVSEECCELGQAALKLRRVLTGTNPTPVTEDIALTNLVQHLLNEFVLLK